MYELRCLLELEMTERVGTVITLETYSRGYTIRRITGCWVNF